MHSFFFFFFFFFFSLTLCLSRSFCNLLMYILHPYVCINIYTCKWHRNTDFSLCTIFLSITSATAQMKLFHALKLFSILLFHTLSKDDIARKANRILHLKIHIDNDIRKERKKMF
jgi:hypothetical protein